MNIIATKGDRELFTSKPQVLELQVRIKYLMRKIGSDFDPWGCFEFQPPLRMPQSPEKTLLKRINRNTRVCNCDFEKLLLEILLQNVIII